ncbi:adenine nucleotide alpha hydrolase family protein [Fusibacter tunisiensis]|jgi:K+-sensing histidine kinase KdpD|uniref:K+-sensing histidine kinase KdpD n=1 Tax=Fusibacter tunisiensis TaxID=1008308 RepID=A0ABS2MRX5_9FIRM|nr:universal stress protein UspA [Fusibacter tunisiensis]MBM7562163.1 K+-sensing histidine kinase KdpD [Fusibacter tunisiensis]
MKRKKRVLVCVTQQKSCERLIEYGVSLVNSEKDELHVIHVVKENWKYFGQLEEKDALDYLFEVAKKNNAMLTVLKARDIENTLSNFTAKHKITDVVMGESLEKTEQQNMIHRLQDQLETNVRFNVVPVNLEEHSDIVVLENVMSS